MTARTDRE